MTVNEIHVGDIGTVFKGTVMDDTVAVDISGATTKQIILKKPSGEKLTKTAIFVTDGSDGQIAYTTISGDLDEPGGWEIQAKVILASGTWYSDVGNFDVHPNL